LYVIPLPTSLYPSAPQSSRLQRSTYRSTYWPDFTPRREQTLQGEEGWCKDTAMSVLLLMWFEIDWTGSYHCNLCTKRVFTQCLNKLQKYVWNSFAFHRAKRVNRLNQRSRNSCRDKLTMDGRILIEDVEQGHHQLWIDQQQSPT